MAGLSRLQCTRRRVSRSSLVYMDPLNGHMAPRAPRERLPDTIFAIVRVKHATASVWRRRPKRSVYGNRLRLRLCPGAVKPIHVPIRTLRKSQALRAKYTTNRLARSVRDTLSSVMRKHDAGSRGDSSSDDMGFRQ